MGLTLLTAFNDSDSMWAPDGWDIWYESETSSGAWVDKKPSKPSRYVAGKALHCEFSREDKLRNALFPVHRILKLYPCAEIRI